MSRDRRGRSFKFEIPKKTPVQEGPPTPADEEARAAFYDDPAFADIDADPADIATKRQEARRGPKTDAEKADLVRWYFETEKLRHP